MNLPTIVFVLRWMVRDTFRQSLASRAFWLVLGLSGLAILLCLSVSIEDFTAHTPTGEIELYGRDNKPFTGLAPVRGHFSLAFGLVRLEQGRDGEADVLFLQSLLAKFGAGALGILLVLLWTSGFLPEFLQPEASNILLAKPIPRWALLVGKYVGVVGFMAIQTTIFVLGTWLALGIKTSVWVPNYLLTIPIVVICFAILFSVMTLFAVWSRSAVVSLVGTFLFWAATAALGHGRHEMVAQPSQEAGRSGGAMVGRQIVEVGYWVLPKTVDLNYVLHDVLTPAGKSPPTIPLLQTLEKKNEFHPELSVVCSLLFGFGILGLASHRFAMTDY